MRNDNQQTVGVCESKVDYTEKDAMVLPKIPGIGDDAICEVLTSAIDDSPFVAYFEPELGRVSMCSIYGEVKGERYVEDEGEFWKLVQINRDVAAANANAAREKAVTRPTMVTTLMNHDVGLSSDKLIDVGHTVVNPLSNNTFFANIRHNGGPFTGEYVGGRYHQSSSAHQTISLQPIWFSPGLSLIDVMFTNLIGDDRSQNFLNVRLENTVSHTLRFAGEPYAARASTWMPNNPNFVGLAEVRLSLNTIAMNYNAMNRRQLAQEILNRWYGTSISGRFISLRGWYPHSGQPAGRSAYDNLRQTAAGLQATTRPTLNNGTPLANVFLSEDLLRAILRINDQWNGIIINGLAGGVHTGLANDEHFLGTAVDFQARNNFPDMQINTPRGQEWSQHSVDHIEVMRFLENTCGFRTQRTHWSPPVRDPGYFGRQTGAFHVEIWGRNW